MNTVLALAVNLLIAALLAVTIGYAVMLLRRIKMLQHCQADLAGSLGRLDDALRQASSTVVAFRDGASADVINQPSGAAPAAPHAVSKRAAATRPEPSSAGAVRPADGKPLTISAAPRRASEDAIRRQAAANELLSVMQAIRKVP